MVKVNGKGGGLYTVNPVKFIQLQLIEENGAASVYLSKTDIYKLSWFIFCFQLIQIELIQLIQNEVETTKNTTWCSKLLKPSWASLIILLHRNNLHLFKLIGLVCYKLQLLELCYAK